MRLAVLALFSAPFLALALSTAAAAGDPAAGHAIAKDSCSRCHDIEKGGAFKKRPPSFQSIAIYRAADDVWARVIAPSPHSGMPDTQWTLTPDQVQDVVAYITSLDVPVTLAP